MGGGMGKSQEPCVFVCFGGMHIYVLYTIKRATRRQKRNDEAASPFEPDHNEVAITPPKKERQASACVPSPEAQRQLGPLRRMPPHQGAARLLQRLPRPGQQLGSTASSTCVLFGGLVNGGEIGVVFQMRVT